MNLTKLFEMQRELDNRIVREKELEGQDLLPRKILALQVEIGELANEWRGFKFWSKDQEPRTAIKCSLCEDGGGISAYYCDDFNDGYIDVLCPICEGEISDKNPLLEEYIDCLHFILSIGIEIKAQLRKRTFPTTGEQHNSELISDRFIELMGIAVDLYYMKHESYNTLLLYFFDLGYMLGFTWEQIEQAYMDKNKTNHERQNTGY